MRQVLDDIHAKISTGAIPDKEADVWKAVVSGLQDWDDCDNHTKNHERPLARNLDVGDRIRREGYKFSHAYVFAPYWTTPHKKANSKLSNLEFADDLSRRYIFSPGDGRGSLLHLVREEVRQFPMTDADSTAWRLTSKDTDMRRTTRGGGSAGQ